VEKILDLLRYMQQRYDDCASFAEMRALRDDLNLVVAETDDRFCVRLVTDTETRHRRQVKSVWAIVPVEQDEEDHVLP
jgi:hypothetical protein